MVSSESLSRYGQRKLSGFEIQWRVVNALVYRELRRRVADVKGGFLGVLIEPVGAIAVWVSILTLVRGRSNSDLNIVLFLTSGVILFTLFSQIAQRGLSTLEANKALLFYRRVKPIDTVIGIAITETGLYASCMTVIMIGTWSYLDSLVMADFSLFVVTFLLMATLGLSMSIFCMLGSHYSANFKSIYPWINRILFFSSGTLFSVANMPQNVRNVLYYNPLLHCIELSRHALSFDYQAKDVNLGYPAAFSLVFLSLALWCYTNNERNLLRR